jgi:hypothetical protein
LRKGDDANLGRARSHQTDNLVAEALLQIDGHAGMRREKTTEDVGQNSLRALVLLSIRTCPPTLPA